MKPNEPNKLSDLQKEFEAKKKLEEPKIPESIKPPGGLIEPIIKKGRGRPPGSKSKTVALVKTDISEKMNRDTIKGLLQMPFTLGRIVTGYPKFEIPPLMLVDLVNSGYNVYRNFGFDRFQKWLDIANFSVGYISALGIATAGLIQYQKEQKKLKEDEEFKELHEEIKKDVKPNISGIRAAGERKNNPDKTPDKQS